MTAKAIVLALMLTAVLLSGCSDGGDDDPEGTSSPTATKSGSASTTKSGSTSSTGTGTSMPGTITVNFTRSTPNAAVPLAVSFSLDADFSKSGKPAAAPADAAWSVRILAGNATNQTSTAGPAGKAFPSNFTLNFTTAGNHTVVVNVTATGYAPANATIIVVASPGGSPAQLLFDGAEADGSQWTFSNEFQLDLILVREPSGEAHPLGDWEASEDEAHTGTKSWHAPYGDHYEGLMTSIALPSPATTLTYWLKGGAEGNGVDGLYVYAGPDAASLTQVGFHGGPAIDWTPFTAGVPAGSKVVQFRMYSDASCSSDPVPVGGADDVACAPGWDAGGYYVDDITVA